MNAFTPPPTMADLQAFVQSVANLQTDDEMVRDDDPDSGMSGDDAVETLNNLVLKARNLA